MSASLLSSVGFVDEALRGSTWRREFEAYADGGGSCGALVLGDPIDGTAYPLILASVRVPGLAGTYRVDANWIRQAAPCQFRVTIAKSILNLPFTVNQSSLVLSVVMADTAGNEEALIRDGQVLIVEGGL